jgi:hypothetical protein
MQTSNNSKLSQASPLSSEKSLLQWFVIGFIFIAAFSLRLHNIVEPPLDYVPVRQYQSAHIARGYYFENLDTVSNQRKAIAELNMTRMGFLLEPRILEHMSVLGYRIMGKETLWIPRVLSSIFWMIGGIFLFLIAKRIASSGEALFSTVFYLFLPFGISASRSFQPDPLMTMMMLFSIFTIVKYYERPSYTMLILAAAVTALALLVKPYILFPIYATFVSLSLFNYGVKKSLFNAKTILFFPLSFSPTLIYYIMGILENVGFLQELAQGSFLPNLFLHAFFWKDWFNLIGHVIGYIPFICSLVGLFMFREGMSRALMFGLWIGYFVFGLFFTFHIHTHAYYHLLFVPIVALSVAPVGALVLNGLLKFFSSRKRLVFSVVLLLALVLVLGQTIRNVQLRDYKDQLKTLGAFIGVNPEFYQFLTGKFDKEVRVAKEIGELVQHNTNTVFLTPFYGRYIAYHGEFAGLPWHITFSLQQRKERGLKMPPKEELLNLNYLTIRTHIAKTKDKYMRHTPDYFIVTAFDEYKKQTDVKEFLSTNFPVIAQNEDYLIFDLRKMSKIKE